MGLKRITARIDVTYPADEPATFGELVATTRFGVADGISADTVGTLESFTLLRTSVDPDPEPEAPTEPEGRTAP